jgi:hypothetical protein
MLGRSPASVRRSSRLALTASGTDSKHAWNSSPTVGLQGLQLRVESVESPIHDTLKLVAPVSVCLRVDYVADQRRAFAGRRKVGSESARRAIALLGSWHFDALRSGYIF